ncbi:MAG: Ig-like domain repeat protein, partial [Anaerolineales bacterium]|nr:Ig-like domain repeat protein [Anaerolineales bacterium]
VGLVSAATNLGQYYNGAGTAEGDLVETAVSLQSPPTSGTYGTKVSLSALLTANGEPLANQFLSFRIGSQTRTALTDASGVAAVEMPLLGLPGDTDMAVIYGGDLTYQSSFDTAPFTVNKQATSLVLEPAEAIVEEGGQAPFVATLMDAAERPFGQKTVFFIISGENGAYAEAVITDFAGRASLTALPLPIGEYTVDVYFSGVVPLPSGSLNLADDRYLPATTSGSLSIVEPASEPILYISTSSHGEIADIQYQKEDVLGYNLETGEWSLLFDGSDVGLAGQNVTAFAWLPDGSLLVAVEKDFYLPQLDRPAVKGRNVENSDILRFEPTSLGNNTSGTWSLYFDGSDVGLKAPREGITALSVLADGRIVISTAGPFKAGNLNAKSRDLVVFTPSSLGENTAGSWELYFEGASIRMLSAKKESIQAVHVDEETGSIYLVTRKGNGQILVCDLGEDGQSCSFELFWNGPILGMHCEQIDAIAIR